MFLVPLHPTNGDILELIAVPGGIGLDVRTREARDKRTNEYLVVTAFSASQIKKILRSIHYGTSYFSDDRAVKIWCEKDGKILVQKYGSASLGESPYWELDVEESKAFANFLNFCANPQLIHDLVPYQFVKDDSVEFLLADGTAFPQKLDSVEYWTILGARLGTMGNLDLSNECFKKALRIDPDCFQAKMNIAANLGRVKAFDEAIQMLSEIPNEVERRNITLANILYDAGRNEEAVEYYEKAIAEEPDLYFPYIRLLQILEDTGGAVFEYYLEQAIQHERVRKSPWITAYYCRHLLHEGKVIELSFVNWLDQLVSVNDELFIFGPINEPYLITEAKLAHLIAQVYVSGDKQALQKAVEELQKFPEDWDLCIYARLLVSAAAQSGLPELISSAYKRICPSCTYTNGILAHPETILSCAYSASGDHDKAISLCEKVLAEDPNHLETLKCYCTYLDRANHPDKAIPVTEKIYQLNPEEPNIFYNLGYICSRNGQFGKAQNWYQKQIYLDPDHYAAMENLVFINLCQKQIDDAKKCFEDYCQKMLVVEGSPNEEWHTVATLTNNPKLEEEKHKEQRAYLAEIIRRKTIKFNRLVELAIKTQGSPIFSLQLENANKADEPVLGAYTEIERNPFSMENILSTLGRYSEAHNDEVRFQLNQILRGDYSAILSGLISKLPFFDQLPLEAQTALADGEKLLEDAGTGNFSTSVFAFSKAVEVALRQLVLVPFRQKYRYETKTEREINNKVIEEQRRGADKFLKYVEKGNPIGLGEMAIAFELCNLSSALKAPCVRKLRSCITGDLRYQRLLDQKSIDNISELARDYRNKAVHSDSFDRNAALNARALSIEILSCFQPVADLNLSL